MIHSQLKIKYPNVPWIWEYNNMMELFDCKYTEKTRKEVISSIIDLMINNKKDRNEDYDYDIIKFLMDITDDKLDEDVRLLNNKYKFCVTEQTIPKNKIGKHLWVNFHTAIYGKYKQYIDESYIADYLWYLIPISGDVKAIMAKSSLHRQIQRSLENNIDTENQSNNHDKNTHKRVLIKREIQKPNEKMDVIKSTKKITNVIQTNKSNNNRYCYIKDKSIVQSYNGIYRFSPITSGRIKINNTSTDQIYFVTIMVESENLYFTLHKIKIL